MFVKTLTFGNYKYRVFYKSKAMSCKYPKETVSPRIRSPRRYWVNNKNKTVREIIYPEDLWFKPIEPDDPVENFILNISFELDYTKLEIEKKIT